MDTHEHWNITGFDAVIGNPPYNANSTNKGSGHKLWDKFMEKGIQEWCSDSGYVVYVHPSLWRQPGKKIFTAVKQYDLQYLNINNEKEGLKQFKCATRFDWYLLKKSKYSGQTHINDENQTETAINIKNWDFIPNGYFNDVFNIIDKYNCHHIISDRSNYGADKKWVSKTKTGEFKYPVVYSLYKNGSIQFRYSNTFDRGHFNIPKVIFTPNLGLNNLIDQTGEYGLTQWVMAICDDPENLQQITTIFKNEKFKNILKAIKFGMYYNGNIIKMFKKNFWKDFVN